VFKILALMEIEVNLSVQKMVWTFDADSIYLVSKCKSIPGIP
jgi:hypothetical protein